MDVTSLNVRAFPADLLARLKAEAKARGQTLRELVLSRLDVPSEPPPMAARPTAPRGRGPRPLPTPPAFVPPPGLAGPFCEACGHPVRAHRPIEGSTNRLCDFGSCMCRVKV